MNKRLYFFLILFFTGLFHLVKAQDDRWIEGKIIAAHSNDPIPFATIKLKSLAKGVVSNADGSFQLPFRYRMLDDTLVISCIGYNTRMVAMNTLQSNALNSIRLTEAVRQLSEVEVRSRRQGRLTGYKIVQAAIRNLDRNLPNGPFCYEAYYRDYQLVDRNYTNLNEAFVQVLDSGFQTNDQVKTKIRLFEYRRNPDFKRDSSIEIAYDNRERKFVPNAELKPFGGNELTILRVHDPIRNNNSLSFSFVYNLRLDFLKNHSFSLGDEVFLDNVPLYCVNFVTKQTVTGDQHYARGKIYIEHRNFGIHKIEYAGYQKSGNKLLFDIQVEYSKLRETMYLNYISFNNFFKVRDPADFKITDMWIDSLARSLTIQVNHFPDPKSAMNKRNYQLSVDGVRLEIEKIEIGDRSKEIVLWLKKNRVFSRWEHPANILARMDVSCKGVKDPAGKELDRVTFISVNQFREMFVQHTDPDGCQVADQLFMRKNRPLFQNVSASPTGVVPAYWMNTPLKKR